MKYLITLLTLSFFISAGFLHAQTKVIYAGTLLAVPGTSPKTEQTIVIQD